MADPTHRFAMQRPLGSLSELLRVDWDAGSIYDVVADCLGWGRGRRFVSQFGLCQPQFVAARKVEAAVTAQVEPAARSRVREPFMAPENSSVRTCWYTLTT
jgi:hypothetical protein